MAVTPFSHAKRAGGPSNVHFPGGPFNASFVEWELLLFLLLLLPLFLFLRLPLACRFSLGRNEDSTSLSTESDARSGCVVVGHLCPVRHSDGDYPLAIANFRVAHSTRFSLSGAVDVLWFCFGIVSDLAIFEQLYGSGVEVSAEVQ